MRTYLEYKDGSSRKFWSVEQSGKCYTVHYGRIGSKGTTKAKSLASSEAASKECLRLIRTKEDKGYKATSKAATPKRNSTSSIKKAKPDVSKIKMPKRYQEFIESGEYLEHQGKFAVDLPGYADDVKLKVQFARKSLPGKLLDNDIDCEEYPEFIALAELAGEPQFLAIDRSKRQCPVLMWEHETGDFVPYAKSLDVFLGGLVTGQEFRARINRAW